MFAQNTAEDLWGNNVNIQQAVTGRSPTVIVPFSTSNCGYCMIDGFFTGKNYVENNDRYGGNSYHMSLFNPQLDIYSFQKHFKWKGAILTAPTSLYRYHEDGFPTLLAFKDGKQLLKEFYNYSKFDTLKMLLWDTSSKLIPTGEKHMADRFIYENESDASVVIFPDDFEIPADMIKMAEKFHFSCKHMNELNPEDRNKHLKLKGGFDFTGLRDFFPAGSVPFTFKDNRIILGEYSFDFDSTGIYCCFPNPFNKEKYVVIEQDNPNAKISWQVNYLDYLLFTGSTKETAKRLLYGHFDKGDDYRWKFDDELAFSDADKAKHCLTVCKIPGKKKLKPNPARTIPVLARNRMNPDEWIIGNDNCRFPDVAADAEGNVWVAWEENGDIGLASVDKEDMVTAWWVENDASDSYGPQVIASGNEVWIFYLNDHDSYYRLYGRSFDGLRFSDAILISEKGPFDVVTPDVSTDSSGDIAIAWSEWKANYRFLKFRLIVKGILQDIKRVQEAPPVYTQGYTNAWYPSITYNGSNEIWGAWNQHYPSTLCLCGGKLGDTAASVTMEAQQMDDRENGGYPCIFADDDQHLFVVWESFAWDVVNENKPQRIKIAGYNNDSKSWSIGKVISMDSQTRLCQTPAGICDKDGNKVVAWSGRPEDESKPWGLYLAKESAGHWSMPVRLSGDHDNDRHPKITIDRGGRTWITCHSGTGSNMRVKLIRVP